MSGPIFRRFVADRRGNIAIIFALALLPVLAAMGCAVDYAMAARVRTKLLAAADAASVGSVARTSRAFIAAGAMSSDGSIAEGVTEATQIFEANMLGQSGFNSKSVTATVVKSAAVVTSTVTVSASVPTSFMSIVGKSSLTVGGRSVATSSMPLYIDFYLLLDNSPSMGVGATPSDVAAMVSATTGSKFQPDDKCAFACHDYNDPDNYYNLAKSLGVKTRIDVLRSATQQLMDTAKTTAVYSTQFRMALYDFGASSKTLGLRKLFSLSSDLSSAKTAAGNIDLMGVYGNNDIYTKDQDTPFTSALAGINAEIGAPGAGTSAAPQKYLFFVSDGVADENNTGCLKPLSGSTRCQSPINPALCTTLKNRGIKIAVLYTTYLALPTNNWYNNWIAPFNAGPYGPSPNSEIANNMKACASDDLYFEVSPTDGIADAMNALFQKALNNARIAA